MYGSSRLGTKDYHPYNGAQYYAQPALSGFDLTAPIGGGLDIELTVEPGVQNTFTFGVSRLSSHALARFAVLEDSLGTLRELTSELITKQGSNLMKFQPTGNTVILHISNEDLYNIVYISIVDWYKSQTKTVQETILVDVCDEDKDRYRFGFNGQEKVNEWAGIGNHLSFDARGYDSRRAGWYSVDPLSKKYPFLSSYHFAANNPIRFIDPDGKKITIKENPTSKEYLGLATSIAILRIINKEKYEFLVNSDIEFQISYKDLNPQGSVKTDAGNKRTLGLTMSSFVLNQGVAASASYDTDGKPTGSVTLTRNRTLEEQDELRERPDGASIMEKDKNRITTSVDEVKKMKLVETSKVIPIYIDNSLKNKSSQKKRTEIVGHEAFGHGYFNATNPVDSWIGAKLDLPEDDPGHGNGNPSGPAAENAEAEVKENYKNALKEYNASQK